MSEDALSLWGEAPVAAPSRFNMTALVLAGNEAAPEKPALIVSAGAGAGEVVERIGHEELAAQILGTAEGMRRRGVGRGDRVAIRLGNTSDFPLAFFGAVALGAIAVPLSAALTEVEARPLLDRLDPALIVADASDPAAPVAGPEERRAWRRLPPAAIAATGASDPAYLVFTSGSGGRPKGVLHAHRAAWARRLMWEGWYGLTPDDRMLHAGAFNWTYTLGAGLTDPWAAGATAIVHLGGDDWPRVAEARRATIFAAVPGVYRKMARGGAGARAALASLRHGLTAGERMVPSLAAEVADILGLDLHEALGMTECSTFVSSSPDRPAPPGRAGWAQPGRRIAVLGEDGRPVPRGEPGTLAVDRRDPGLMLGYWEGGLDARMPVEGGPDWFLTGDRVEMNADGAIAHLGRIDDVMTALGYRVDPQEVEEAMADAPGVAEVGVAEVRVREDLTLIAGFVVPGSGDALDDAALDAHAAARLAPYKRPRLWVRAAALPRSPNGKLRRRALPALFTG